MNESGRVEAFSDGVFAIAITLLILEIKVPHDSAGTLGRALLAEWPSYVAFFVSFFTVGVMWMNHHRLFDLVAKPDDILVGLNLLLLLGVTWIPFPTAVLAAYLQTSGERVAGIVYAASFLGISIVFQLLRTRVTRTPGMLRVEKKEHARGIHRQYWWGPLMYVIAIVIALVSGTAVLIWSGLVAVYFALPPTMWGRTGGSPVLH